MKIVLNGPNKHNPPSLVKIHASNITVVRQKWNTDPPVTYQLPLPAGWWWVCGSQVAHHGTELQGICWQHQWDCGFPETQRRGL